jgi:UDP-N-acetylmuramate dehydrogenase
MGRPSAEKIKPYTTFGIGGEAQAVSVIRKPAELIEVVSATRKDKTSYQLIAGGSNVVFPDKFYPGLIIVFRDPMGKVRISGQALECDASLPLAKLISGAVKAGLGGLEALSGIPGTVGGAIVGNAGAYGQSISDKLMAVEIFDGKKTRWLEKKACKFAYRDSIFKHKDWLVLRARFELEKGDGKELAKKSRGIIKVRNKKYEPGLKCPGSFFKNVLVKNISKSSLKLIDSARIIGDKIPAGYLLETVGAKGMRVGGIYVADFHGNLLINDGTGTYAEVKKLANRLKQKVFKKFGIAIEEEVRYMV